VVAGTGECVHEIYGDIDYPKYSYIYNYTNTTSCGPNGNCDIEYPEYNVTTNCKKDGEDNYEECDGNSCPCDLNGMYNQDKYVTDITDGNVAPTYINKIIGSVASSVAEQ
jgi:hypothetical protein